MTRKEAIYTNDIRNLREAEMACTFRIINGVPANHGVVIKEAGVVFSLKENGTVKDGPRIVNLASGAYADFHYNGSECVDEAMGAIEITIPNKPNKNLQFIKKPVAPIECMTFADAVLAPKASVFELTIQETSSQILESVPSKYR